MQKAIPTGTCWCGCGVETRRGSFFAAGHDRIAETAVVQTRYGSVPEFLLHHGFGPGKLNPRDELAALRSSERNAPKTAPVRQAEKATNWRDEAAKLWPVLIDLARRRRTATYKDVGAVLDIFHRNLRLPLDLIAKHCDAEHLPKLSVLVVNADTGLPGAGFTGSPTDLERLREEVFARDWLTVANPFDE